MHTIPERVRGAINEIKLCQIRKAPLDAERATALQAQLNDTIAVLAEHGLINASPSPADELAVTYPGQP